MRRIVPVLVVTGLALSLPSAGSAQAVGDTRWSGARPIPPLVSAAWLEQNLGAKDLVTIDVRPAADYAAGHVERSVSMPFVTPVSAWSVTRDGLTLEVPDDADLLGALGAAGITARSTVVIVTSAAQPPATTANGTRVAATLAHAGLADVAVLDGGYERWVAEGRATTTAVPTVKPRTYRGPVRGGVFVDRAYVEARIGRARLVDARSADAYAGTVPDAGKAGHLPTAVSLPAASIWNADGTYKSTAELAILAWRALGSVRGNEEIIVYCSTGRLATTWHHVLTEVLWYRNVKVYDGSVQDWARYHDLVM